MAPTATIDLVQGLAMYPSETEWLEFKVSNPDAPMIGRTISALANSAAYHGRDTGYLIWGVDDRTHDLVGTTFDYLDATHGPKGSGGVLLTPWLRSMLSRNASYEFATVSHEGRRFVVLSVRAPVNQPVSFNGKVYIREGAATVELKTGTAKELELWRRLQRANFESQVAMEDVGANELTELLDLSHYFKLLGMRSSLSNADFARPLVEQGLLRQQDDGRYAITNLAALLIAHDLTEFTSLTMRQIRIVRFVGDSSIDIRENREFRAGYAIALPQIEEYLSSILPGHERLVGAFRRVELDFPWRAIRELVLNATVHQDLSDPNAGPLVRIYDHRLEFSNPGISLVPPKRVLNDPPVSRNAALVRQLRLLNLCEEIGTGWDRAVAACEALHVPAPEMQSDDERGTVVTLRDVNEFDAMTRAEQLSATYWHACLRYASNAALTNESLRHRFGLTDESRVRISRLIKRACDDGLIRVRDTDRGNRYREYLPILP